MNKPGEDDSGNHRAPPPEPTAANTGAELSEDRAPSPLQTDITGVTAPVNAQRPGVAHSGPIEDLSEDRAPATLEGTSSDPGEPADPDSKRGAQVVKRKRGSKPLNSLRHTLTITIIAAIFVLAVLLMLLVAFNKEPETQAALREVGTLILPPMLTLAGTSFAWFFAKRDKGGEGDK